MTPSEFKAALEILYGADWAYRGSEALGMSARNVRAFAASEKGIHPGLAAEVEELVIRELPEAAARVLARILPRLARNAAPA